MEVADQIIRNLKNSQNITHQSEKRVQDAYSIRCAPQVHGASLDVFSPCLKHFRYRNEFCNR